MQKGDEVWIYNSYHHLTHAERRVARGKILGPSPRGKILASAGPHHPHSYLVRIYITPAYVNWIGKWHLTVREAFYSRPHPQWFDQALNFGYLVKVSDMELMKEAAE